LTHRRSHQALALILQLPKLPYLPDAHIRIATISLDSFFENIYFEHHARVASIISPTLSPFNLRISL